MTPPFLSDSQIDRSSTAAGLVPSTPVEELGEAIAELAARLHAATPPESIVEEVSSAQRRADALALLAERALENGLDGGSAADRYHVILHLQQDTPGDCHSQAVLELADGGIHVSAETSQRLSCDASLVEMREGTDGSVLDIGRKTRTIPPAIRRALTARDERCRFPGCTARRCDAHHITHWADGGATSLDNLVLLCRRHHRMVHEGGYDIGRGWNHVTFVRPDGRRIEESPSLAAHAPLDIDDRVTAGSLRCWDGTRLNVGYVIDVLRQAPDWFG